jgi:hypothetical protein
MKLNFARYLRSLTNLETPVKLAFRCLLTLLIFYVGFAVAKPAFNEGGGAALSALMITLILGLGINILWRHAILDFITNPLTALFTGGNEPPEAKPYYSIAISKRKCGQYEQAIQEVCQQLERFPNDFEGVMLLAAIQAENLNDLPAADYTLTEFSDRPETPSNMVILALIQLADWHLNLALDSDSARVTLQEIVGRFPGTAAALQAEQRLGHLDETIKILLSQQHRQKVVIPQGVQDIGLLDSTQFLQPKENGPGQLATEYVQHLECHPRDAEVREKLATLYARDLMRLDLAELELEHLINEPGHKPKQVVHWLDLLATFQIELGADIVVVQSTLNIIIKRFPDLPAAEMAQRRLALLNNEFRGRRETSTVKLGVYEQNIGLKSGSPRQFTERE